MLAKKPYDDVALAGLVEGRFIYSTVLGRHVLPFVLNPPATVVLPVRNEDGVLDVVDANNLVREGYRNFGRWMHDAEKIWETKRGEKADKQTAYGWLDYQGKLSSQNLKHRYLVLYNAEGTNVSATFFDRKSHPLSLIVEHTIYWAAFSNKQEAAYLCAVLNSRVVNRAIKPFQATGLMGERHIQKKVLELPIPTFDSAVPVHLSLAQLGEDARLQTEMIVGALGFPNSTSIARQRAFVREQLKSALNEIDSAVTKLLS